MTQKNELKIYLGMARRSHSVSHLEDGSFQASESYQSSVSGFLNLNDVREWIDAQVELPRIAILDVLTNNCKPCHRNVKSHIPPFYAHSLSMSGFDLSGLERMGSTHDAGIESCCATNLATASGANHDRSSSVSRALFSSNEKLCGEVVNKRAKDSGANPDLISRCLSFSCHGIMVSINAGNYRNGNAGCLIDSAHDQMNQSSPLP